VWKRGGTQSHRFGVYVRHGKRMGGGEVVGRMIHQRGKKGQKRGRVEVWPNEGITEGDPVKGGNRRRPGEKKTKTPIPKGRKKTQGGRRKKKSQVQV